ncbi:hypothetical protein LTR84_006542 [Exophiala bonariae]|uniref:Rhamnolipids biosynthesis 3-oxoacyl-[acyl-carrier-protein] reductase n=1 Tax=Exophiala bonariae TaxID=1690606 RepID=A0AAV9N0Z7_9EURO|nr:hypothetical protein LTR84_006542 [Exophiala bonariae]
MSDDKAPQTSHFSNDDLKISKLFDVSHITAVVTGGGTGIGLMIAQALKTNGAKVYITGRRQEALDKVVEQYGNDTGSGKIIALPGDGSKKEECVRLAKEVASKESNGIHLLVNNAGIARDDNTKFSAAGKPDFSSAESISQHMLKSEPQSWADTFETNVTGQYWMSAAFLPLLAKGREVTPGYTSSIVNISSISGLMKGSSSGQFAYASSKAALVHLTRMLATTLSETKVRVNQIAPGVFPSEMTTGESDESQKSELSSKMGNPAGRGGSDADMAASILYLVSPGGVFLNNQLLHPEGGQLLVAPAAI